MAIQGFLSSVNIDGNDYNSITGTFTFDRTRAVLEKATMDGTAAMKTIPGITSGTISINGWVNPAEWNLVEITLAKEDVVTFAITADAGLGTDLGWSGNLSIASVNVDVDTDDAWQFTLDGETSGAWTFTPSVP